MNATAPRADLAGVADDLWIGIKTYHFGQFLPSFESTGRTSGLPPGKILKSIFS